MRKITFLIVSFALTAFVLSGCFNTQSVVSYEFYSQSTPASLLHVYVKVKTIRAGNLETEYNKDVDLVSNLPTPVANNIGVNVPFDVDAIEFSVLPTATVVYTNGATTITKVFQISNASDVKAYFYDYSNQRFEKSDFSIGSVGQNKTIMVLWNLSDFSTPDNSKTSLNAISLDSDKLVRLKVEYKAPRNGTYFAEVSDGMNTFTFTKRCREDNYDFQNEAYTFVLYPFCAPVQGGYSANVSINNATQTVASTEISISSSNLKIVLP